MNTENLKYLLDNGFEKVEDGHYSCYAYRRSRGTPELLDAMQNVLLSVWILDHYTVAEIKIDVKVTAENSFEVQLSVVIEMDGKAYEVKGEPCCGEFSIYDLVSQAIVWFHPSRKELDYEHKMSD